MPGLVPSQPDDRTRSTAIAALLVATATCTGSAFAEQPDARAAPRPGRQATVSVIARSVKPREPAGTAVVAYGLTRDDYHRVVTGIPVLKQAVPVREATHIVRHHDRETDVRLIGTTSEYGSAHAIRIERGRFLTDRDVRTSENVAVIGHGIAERLFPGEDPIGESLRIGDAYFLVVGKRSRAPARSARADRRRPDLEVYVPLTTMGSRLGDLTVIAKSGSVVLERFELSRIEITLDDPAEADEVAEAIRRLLKPFHEQPDYSVEVVR